MAGASGGSDLNRGRQAWHWIAVAVCSTVGRTQYLKVRCLGGWHSTPSYRHRHKVCFCVYVSCYDGMSTFSNSIVERWWRTYMRLHVLLIFANIQWVSVSDYIYLTYQKMENVVPYSSVPACYYWRIYCQKHYLLCNLQNALLGECWESNYDTTLLQSRICLMREHCRVMYAW